MTLLPQALDDPERLRAVEALQLVGAPFEDRFDRVTRTAQRVLDVPMAFLNLIDAQRLWVTSCVGFDEREVDRDVAFCSHAVVSPEPLVVGDLTADPRFAQNPLVVSAPYLRAYAGRRLQGPSGQPVGTLCVMDVRPRTWTADDVAALHDLAGWAEEELAHGDVVRRLQEGDRVRREHEQVLMHAGQGILGIDARGVIRVANPTAAALTGWPPGDLVGRELHTTLHPTGADGAPCTSPACAAGPAPLSGKVVLRHRDALVRRDGSRMPAQLSCAPMVEDGEVVGAVVVFDDITQQLAVDKAKDEFVSVVSHELRTPLTALRGSLGLLAAGVLGQLSDQGQEMADIAVSSTERLARLVEDILDLERLAAGRIVLARTCVPLDELAAAAVASVTPAADAAGITVRTTVDAGAAWLDRHRMGQVLGKLLGNAVKFSDPGSAVELRIRPVADAVVLEVEDRGRGIPADQLERVFERFTQADAVQTRDRGGPGLGLAIARNIVQAHGGSLLVTSEPGTGTTFVVVLPQRRDPSPQLPSGRRADDRVST